jgi:putative spermidine/putrescine transport system ATP-binding protein
VVGEPPAGEPNRVEVGIEVVEYHGRELAVQARLPEGQALLLRTPTRVSRGETVPVWVPRDRVLVFGNTTDGPPAEEAAGPSAGVAGPPVPGGATHRVEADREHEVTPS